MAHWWNKTKKKTVLRIRLGRDQGKSRCLVALSKRWKTGSDFDRSHLIAALGTRLRDKRSHRRAGNKNPERCPPSD